MFLVHKGIPVQLLGFNAAAKRIVDPLDGSLEVGRGFDTSVPAVFRAKVAAKMHLPQEQTTFWWELRFTSMALLSVLLIRLMFDQEAS